MAGVIRTFNQLFFACPMSDISKESSMKTGSKMVSQFVKSGHLETDVERYAKAIEDYLLIRD